MDWKTLLTDMYAASGEPKQRPVFQAPASADEIRDLETQAGGTIAGSLGELLGQTNGVLDQLQIGGQWIDNMWLIWPCAAMLENRSSDVPSGYLPIAPAGADGITFIIELSSPDLEPPIFVWYPINSTIERIASSFADFLPGWINGSVSV